MCEGGDFSRKFFSDAHIPADERHSVGLLSAPVIKPLRFSGCCWTHQPMRPHPVTGNTMPEIIKEGGPTMRKKPQTFPCCPQLCWLATKMAELVFRSKLFSG